MLEGVGIGLACTGAVGVATFALQQKLPYRRMLVGAGVLIGAVLMVMIGGTALSFVELGWVPAHRTPFTMPHWMGSWFEMYSYWETLGAQLLAGLFVVGSYYAAQYVRVRRPRARGERVAVRAKAAPSAQPSGLATETA